MNRPRIIAAGFSLLAGPLFAGGPWASPPPTRNLQSPSRPPPPAVAAAPVGAPDATAPALTTRQYQDLQAAVTTPPLAERQALYTQNIGHGVKVQAIGAPLPPIFGESPAESRQVRIPLIGIAW